MFSHVFIPLLSASLPRDSKLCRARTVFSFLTIIFSLTKHLLNNLMGSFLLDSRFPYNAEVQIHNERAPSNSCPGWYLRLPSLPSQIPLSHLFEVKSSLTLFPTSLIPLSEDSVASFKGGRCWRGEGGIDSLEARGWLVVTDDDVRVGSGEWAWFGGMLC